jgi:arylsulfatase A
MPHSKITKRLRYALLACCTFFISLTSNAGTGASDKPNIVFVFADDFGYGDASSYNPDSKIKTPHIDQLAHQGIRFTDAHAPGAYCIPSRYGLLTGRYPYRDNFRFIDANRMTLPGMLKNNGYNTAMVGKWHLSFDNFNKDKFSRDHVKQVIKGMQKNPQPLTGGPIDRGFDSYFGIWASLDIPPYFYIRDRQIVKHPSEHVAASNTPGWTRIQGEFWREGAMPAGFKHEEVLPNLTSEAVNTIDRLSADSKNGKPFFLYFALTGPHTPWLPTKAFKGKSQVGLYGDFVMQVDDTLGQVVAALEKNGISDNTLVIFTSDNGPVWYQHDRDKYHHSAAGILRGMKADSWEGAHRMPFVARWPGKIKTGTVSNELFAFNDLMATFADIVGGKIPASAKVDSVSILPALLGKNTQPLRDNLYLKDTVVRKGPWKMINHLASGGFTKPKKEKPAASGPTGQLYNLDRDPSETNNLWLKHPDIVAQLMALMENIQKQ